MYRSASAGAVDIHPGSYISGQEAVKEMAYREKMRKRKEMATAGSLRSQAVTSPGEAVCPAVRHVTTKIGGKQLIRR
jgi:hypothetical protein